jgi:hypothetical protein
VKSTVKIIPPRTTVGVYHPNGNGRVRGYVKNDWCPFVIFWFYTFVTTKSRKKSVRFIMFG